MPTTLACEIGFSPSQMSDINALNRPNYALLLSPDTLLPPSALQDMLAFMAAHPEVGAAGPRLALAGLIL